MTCRQLPGAGLGPPPDNMNKCLYTELSSHEGTRSEFNPSKSDDQAWNRRAPGALRRGGAGRGRQSQAGAAVQERNVSVLGGQAQAEERCGDLRPLRSVRIWVWITKATDCAGDRVLRGLSAETGRGQ